MRWRQERGPITPYLHCYAVQGTPQAEQPRCAASATFSFACDSIRARAIAFPHRLVANTVLVLGQALKELNVCASTARNVRKPLQGPETGGDCARAGTFSKHGQDNNKLHEEMDLKQLSQLQHQKLQNFAGSMHIAMDAMRQKGQTLPADAGTAL